MQAYSFLLVSDIIDRAKAETIGATSSQLTALQDTQLIEKVEQINSDFIDAAHTRHHKGGWSWMLNTHNFSTVAHTDLDGATVAGALTLDLTDASDFDSSGRIAIQNARGTLDFVDYESKSSNELTVSTTTGDQTLGIAHSDAERVEKLYAQASDYAKTQKLYVGGREYFYENSDLFPSPTRFTTVGAYLMFRKGLGATDVTHYYYKKPATLTLTTNTTDIPTNFQRYAVESLKAHIYMVRRKRADVPTALQLADIALEDALTYDTNTTATSASYGGIDSDY